MHLGRPSGSGAGFGGSLRGGGGKAPTAPTGGGKSTAGKGIGTNGGRSLLLSVSYSSGKMGNSLIEGAGRKEDWNFVDRPGNSASLKMTSREMIVFFVAGS